MLLSQRSFPQAILTFLDKKVKKKVYVKIYSNTVRLLATSSIRQINSNIFLN